MNPLAAFKAALAALRLNALRSFLAMLGVIIGVASVIVMVSVASGAGQAIEARIRSLGTNLLVIQPGSYTSGGRRSGEGTALALSETDLAVIKERIPGIAAVTGVVSGSAPIVVGNTNWTTSIDGVSADFLEVRDWELAEGRNFTEAELRSAAKVAILGATTARELFADAPVIGQQVRVMNVPFTVVGLLTPKGQSGFGMDQDDTALVPVSTARRRLFGAEKTVPDNLKRIMVEVASAEEMSDAQSEIETLLRQRRQVRMGAPDTFQVRNMAEFIRTRSETQNILSLLLGATAAISLIVGGIGIMNIMLVSVTERTKEIGLRMAVGARRRDILSQFLIEAVTLCLTGGLIGLLIGGSAALALATWGAWPIALSPSLVLHRARRGRPGRRVLRLLPGAPRLADEPHRRAALRVTELLSDLAPFATKDHTHAEPAQHRHRSADRRRRHRRHRLHRRRLCDVHQRGGEAEAPARGLLEQHLVHALLVRRHQLHPSLGLCAVRRRRLVHRRLCHHDLPASRPGLSHPAAGLRRGLRPCDEDQSAGTPNPPAAQRHSSMRYRFAA